MNEELQDFVAAKETAEKRIKAEIDKLLKAYPQIKGYRLKGKSLTYNGTTKEVVSHDVKLEIKF